MLSTTDAISPVSVSPGGIYATMYDQLVRRVAKDRDRDAFAQLFEYFGPRLKAFMIKGGAEAALAEDLVQDVMLKVWQKADQFRPDRGSLGTWIFRIARNTRIDRMRHKSSRPYEDLDTLDLASEDDDSEKQLATSQTAELVADALGELPLEQRQIIELAYLEDMSQSAIAERLSLPIGTVKSRMRLAYVKLRNELEVLQ